jgi:hypothetical protein
MGGGESAHEQAKGSNREEKEVREEEENGGKQEGESMWKVGTRVSWVMRRAQAGSSGGRTKGNK